ncbi:MAG TPA: hypothetical protein VN026_19325 [Bacteroidia bacterium]|nr:hypothetical protein [Bacteroidia bacterium]
MRDLIWTIIGVWVIWRIISAFSNFSSAARKAQNINTNNQNSTQYKNQNRQPKKGELKPDAGEYVDYEDVK